MLGRIRGIGWRRGGKAAENGRNKELYSIVRTITGERRRRKDKQGVLKTSFGSVHRTKHVEHHKELWNSAQDNERGSRHIRKISMHLNRAIQHNQERRRQKICVKDKQGVLKTESKERLQRWLST